MNRATCLVFFAAAAATLAFSRPGTSQCPMQWVAGDPIPFATGDVNASTLWDPDGAGPAPALLVVGGRFGAGTMLSTSLATFDGTQWGALGNPPLPEVAALTVWNGLLVAAGGTGGQHAVATWNGTTWSVIGSAGGRVNALAVFNGELFAGGGFLTMNGGFARCLAQWNGTAWSEPGGGVTGEVMALAVSGSLYVGGALIQAGAVPVSRLAIWSGSSWSAGASFNGDVRCFAVRTSTTPVNSLLFVGGDFTALNGAAAQHVARLQPSTNQWTALSLGGTTCRAIHVRSTGLATFQVHAAVESNAAAKVWRLNGTTWQSLGDVFDDDEPRPTSLAFFNGQYVATFEGFQSFPPELRQAVRVHDGTAWQPAAGPGFDARVHAATSLGNDIVVGGAFRRYGATSIAGVARGGPGAWQPLGSGIAGGLGVFALCRLENGGLVAGGEFTTAGGAAAGCIARWNGTAWSPLGSGVVGRVSALLPLPGGDLIAGGLFTVAGGIVVNNVARWNGTAWSALGTGMNERVAALTRRANGDIVATGAFSTAGGTPALHIARWDGSSWSAIGSGLDLFGLALATLTDDSVAVGGFFHSAGGVFAPSVARWNGSSWLAQSTQATAWDDSVLALAALPNGEYVAGGPTSVFNSGPLGSVEALGARHTGGPASVLWDAFDLRGTVVGAATVMPNGDVVLGGDFDGAGGLASHNLAVLRPTCPAAAVSYGSGCAGAGGSNVLAATALPWAGGTFRARATGMPAVAIVLAVTGFSQLAVPMPLVLPQGVAGCTALVGPDLLDLSLPSGGTVTTQLALPASPSLAGQAFHHQVVPLEMDLVGNIVAITATNGLTLTIGAL